MIFVDIIGRNVRMRLTEKPKKFFNFARCMLPAAGPAPASGAK